jgi:interferon gamma-inducible protein 30
MISTQVWNTYQSILSIVNISFVPYGNAREEYQPKTKSYKFYCQHGTDECRGNLIHVNQTIIQIYLISFFVS